MLISNLKEKDRRGGMTDILLVPELCYATGEYMKILIECQKQLYISL